MASEFASFFERVAREARGLPPILPFIMGIARPDDPESLPDGIFVFNPQTETMMVVRSGAADFESMMRLLAKGGQPPASQASIDAMPTVKIEESGGGECPICLDQFEVDVAKEMPCKHVFHGGCVEKWLKLHGSCPVCRFVMPADEEAPPKKAESEAQTEVTVAILVRATAADSGQTPSDDSADNHGEHDNQGDDDMEF